MLGGATYSASFFAQHPAIDPQGPACWTFDQFRHARNRRGSTVNVGTDFTQTAAGALTQHVAGTVANGGFGKLAVTGNAAFDGAFPLLVDRNFVPVIGDQYVLATFGSTTGDFANASGLQPLFLPLKTATQFTATVQNVPSDLEPLTLAPPASGVAWQAITIPFSIKNLAAVATAANAWTDSIYLSASATFDASATLLGRVPHAGALAAGDSYNAQFTGNLPALFVVAHPSGTLDANEVFTISSSNGAFSLR